MKDLLHIDPITIVVLVIGFISTWNTLKKDSKWHTSWIKKHDEECDDFKKSQQKITLELMTSNTHLTTLAEAHGERLTRLETAADKKGTR